MVMFTPTGCVMFEVAALYPLFPGANEVRRGSRRLCRDDDHVDIECVLQSAYSSTISILSFTFLVSMQQNDQIDRIHKVMGTPSREVTWCCV